MNERSRSRLLIVSVVAIVAVVVLATFYFVTPSGKALYPAIMVTNGTLERNFSWNTTPATSQLLFGTLHVVSQALLNSTRANSTLTVIAAVWGLSEVNECGCGVGEVDYLFNVRVDGWIAPGLDPTSVSVEFDNSGPSYLVYFPPGTGGPSINSSSFSITSATNRSLLATSNLLNETSDRSTYFAFSASPVIEALMAPLANGTIGLNTLHLAASLLGLGGSIVASMTLAITNHYS